MTIPCHSCKLNVKGCEYLKKAYRRVIFLALFTLLLTGTAVAITQKIPARIQAILTVKELLFSKQLEFDIASQNEVFSFSLTRNEIMDDYFYDATLGDIHVYFHDDAIYLDNGRGYDLSEFLERLPDDPEDMLWILLFADCTWENDIPCFEITASTLDRMERLRPEIRSYRALLTGCTLRVSQDLQIKIPELASVTVRSGTGAVDPIPTDLLMVMKAESAEPVSNILPLVYASLALADASAFGADAELTLECGPLPIQDSAQLYVTPEGLWLQRSGSSFAIGIEGIIQNKQAFLGAGYLLCRNGSVTQNTNGDYIYSLVLDTDAVSSFFSQALPEAAGLGIEFQQAQCAITVSDHRLSRIKLSCNGEMPFLITRLPISFSVDLVPMVGTITLPGN